MHCQREQAQEVGRVEVQWARWLIVYRRKTTDKTSPDLQSNTSLPPADSALSPGATYEPLRPLSEHVPHSLGKTGSGTVLPDITSSSADQSAIFFQTPTTSSEIFYNLQPPILPTGALSEGATLPDSQASPVASPVASPPPPLPAYIKPFPVRFGHDDIIYLHNKGVLAIPDQELRNELLRCYAEYQHPFIPLLDWHRFVRIIDQNDGVHQVSLLLFQAVMFTGVATVEMRLLKAAGYNTRREARRAFFDKTRLLYDLDYDDDPIALIQALLLMTYWRENRTGRKEAQHWIEIALSLSYNIGLHRNPEKSIALEPWQQKLYKRIWWSAYVRDVQMALGTPSSTRIRGVDFDVPMLQLADFELETLPNVPSCVPADCKVVRDPEKWRQLAVMCIEMAKLSICVSHILSIRYGVTSSKTIAQTAMILPAERLEPSDDQIQANAKALQEWKDKLPEAAQYVTPILHDMDSSNRCLLLNRAFLHMVYYAALSSLHRSQLLPPSGMLTRTTIVDVSREALRLAATKITTIAGTLQDLDLVRYLPSPAITVLLPAIVAHLLEVLAPRSFLPPDSLRDFCKCMQIMAALRDMYAAADYSTAFLQAAIQRTEIGPVTQQPEGDSENCNIITKMQGLTGTGLQVIPAAPDPDSGQLAPPPVDQVMDLTTQQNNGGAPRSDAPRGDDNVNRRPHSSLVFANSSSDRHLDHGQLVNHTSNYSQNSVYDAADIANDALATDLNHSDGATTNDRVNNFELDFHSTTNLDGAGKIFDVEDGEFGPTQGESGGFSLDTDWWMGITTSEVMEIGTAGLTETGAERLMMVGEGGGSAML